MDGMVLALTLGLISTTEMEANAPADGTPAISEAIMPPTQLALTRSG